MLVLRLDLQALVQCQTTVHVYKWRKLCGDGGGVTGTEISYDLSRITEA